MRQIMILATLALVVGIAALGNGRQVFAGDSTVCSSGADFTTIQEAIDDVGTVAGDTITVCSETFVLASPVVVDKSVTIAGDGIGSTIIQPDNIGFRPEADDVEIREMTIEGGSQAIRFEKAGGTIDGTTISKVRMLNNSSRGVEIHNATTVTNLVIYHSSFENTDNLGSRIGLRVSSSGHIDGAEIGHTLFDGLNIGIYEANDGSSSTMKNVLVTGSTFQDITGSTGTAIFLEEIQNAVIENNTFINNIRDIQIFKWYQASLPVSNLIIRDNTMTGTTDSVFAIFNREHVGNDPGRTEFAGVTFTQNTATIDPSLQRASVWNPPAEIST